MREIPGPSFIQQADALMERIAALDLDENERRALDRLQREKHDLLLKEARFLQELTVWAGMTEAEVNYRKALAETKAASERYYRTMTELNDLPTVKVTEYVAIDAAKSLEQEEAA